jgi:hypothetical protein
LSEKIGASFGLPAPTNAIEAIALDLFVDEARARLARTEIRIKRITRPAAVSLADLSRSAG